MPLNMKWLSAIVIVFSLLAVPITSLAVDQTIVSKYKKQLRITNKSYKKRIAFYKNQIKFLHIQLKKNYLQLSKINPSGLNSGSVGEGLLHLALNVASGGSYLEGLKETKNREISIRMILLNEQQLFNNQLMQYTNELYKIEKKYYAFVNNARATLRKIKLRQKENSTELYKKYRMPASKEKYNAPYRFY